MLAIVPSEAMVTFTSVAVCLISTRAMIRAFFSVAVVNVLALTAKVTWIALAHVAAATITALSVT